MSLVNLPRWPIWIAHTLTGVDLVEVAAGSARAYGIPLTFRGPCIVEGIAWGDPGAATRTWEVALWQPDQTGGGGTGTKVRSKQVTRGSFGVVETYFDTPFEVTLPMLGVKQLSGTRSYAWWMTLYCVSAPGQVPRNPWYPMINHTVAGAQGGPVFTNSVYLGGLNNTWPGNGVSWAGNPAISLMGYGLGDEFDAPQPVNTTASISGVTVIARNVIKVDFNATLAVTDTLLSPSSYSLSPNIAVAEVLPIEDDTTSSILLKLSPKATLGSAYEINIPSAGYITEYTLETDLSGALFTPDQVPIATMMSEWTHHKTKTDSMISNLSQMYSTAVGSNLFHILAGLGISDEEIGGDQ